MTNTERAIRETFPGRNNKGLREQIREAAKSGSVRHLSRYLALTASGRAGLEQIQRTLNNA